MIMFILLLFIYNLQSNKACSGKPSCLIITLPDPQYPHFSPQYLVIVQLCSLGMPGSVISIRCEWWIESEAYLMPPGTPIQSEPTETAAAVHNPSLKPGLRRYEGGTHGQRIFKEGGTKGGRGNREGGRLQPRSTHLVCVEEERIGENSTLKDLSPISVETADRGHDTYVTVTNTTNKRQKTSRKREQQKEMDGLYLKPWVLLLYIQSLDLKAGICTFMFFSTECSTSTAVEN